MWSLKRPSCSNIILFILLLWSLALFGSLTLLLLWATRLSGRSTKWHIVLFVLIVGGWQVGVISYFFTNLLYLRFGVISCKACSSCWLPWTTHAFIMMGTRHDTIIIMAIEKCLLLGIWIWYWVRKIGVDCWEWISAIEIETGLGVHRWLL
jgi:hypothetical protein